MLCLINSAVRPLTIRLYFRRIWAAMASLRCSPATRTEEARTTPPKLITAASVIPPPRSMIIQPLGCVARIPAPRADIRDFSKTVTLLAPASYSTSSTARRSTSVMPHGTATETSGCRIGLPEAFSQKLWSIAQATSQRAMTPSRTG